MQRNYAWALLSVSVLVVCFLIWRLLVVDDRAIITLRSAMVNVVDLFAHEVKAWEREQQDVAERLAQAVAGADEDRFRSVADWLVEGTEVGAVALSADGGRIVSRHCRPTPAACARAGTLDSLRAAMERDALPAFAAVVGDGRVVTIWSDPRSRLLPRVTRWPLQPRSGQWTFVRRTGDSLAYLEHHVSLDLTTSSRVSDTNALAVLALGPGGFHDTHGPTGRRIFAASASDSSGRWGVVRVRDADSLLVAFRSETRRRDWLLLAAGIVLVGVLLLAAEGANERRVRRLTVRAHVEALDAQLRAHFIFNAINTVAELVHEAPRRADAMLVSLGDLLRRSLSSREGLEVPLRRELELVESYLDVERARFGDRLDVTMRVAPTAERALVPAWLLQPVVENAIKHGTEGSVPGAHVEIHAWIEAGELAIDVVDGGRATTPDVANERRGQVGLANVRERLQVTHGPTARVDLRPRVDGGMRVEIRMPHRETSPRV